MAELSEEQIQQRIREQAAQRQAMMQRQLERQRQAEMTENERFFEYELASDDDQPQPSQSGQPEAKEHQWFEYDYN